MELVCQREITGSSTESWFASFDNGIKARRESYGELEMNWNAITIGKLNSIERNSSSWGMHRSMRHFVDFFFAQYFEYFHRFKSFFRCWYRWIVSLSSDKFVRNLRHIDDFCFAQYFRRFKTFVQWWLYVQTFELVLSYFTILRHPAVSLSYVMKPSHLNVRIQH